MDKFDIKTREIEFKYDAKGISLSQFNEVAKSLKPQRFIEVSSWDIYYAPVGESSFQFEFMRLRFGPNPQLTIKVKTTEKNNNDRIEIDIPLDPGSSQEYLTDVVAAYCKQLNFKENFRIYKWCQIYFYEKTDMVYYIVSDGDMKEKGRFIEVEARKDSPIETLEEAEEVVKKLERQLSALGLTPQNRTKLSQWERNRVKA